MITYESAKKLEKVFRKPEYEPGQNWYDAGGRLHIVGFNKKQPGCDNSLMIKKRFTYAPSVGDLLKLLPHYQLRWNPKENTFDCSANIWGIPMSSSSHVIAEEAVALEIFKVYKITI